MSDVGSALSGGGTDTSGVNDQTFADATLGDQIQGGTGDFGGSAAAGPTEFNQFSDIANALSSGAPAGASPTVAQSIAMSPPAAAGATGGDPVGAASGTQSSTTPGSTPANSNQPQPGQGQQQQQQDHAPPSAVNQLKVLLKELSGKPTGPTGQIPLPMLAPGQTGPQSPQMPLPGLAVGQTGRPSFSPAMIGGMPNEGGIANLPSLAAGETGPPSGRTPGDALDQVAGAPPAEARLPPDAATQPGRDITVRKAAPQAMPFPQNEPGEVAPGGPALPTRKPTQPEAEQPAAEPPQDAPQPTPPPPRLLQDITGASTGAPIPLAQLAQVAMTLLPLIGMFAGGGGRRGGHRGGWQGMRGFRPFGAPGGLRGGCHPGGRFGHPAWRGAWPYHHPEHGWDMHHHHPGGGWLPLNPVELQGLGGGPQGGQPGAQDPNAPDPNRPPKEGGSGGGSYSPPVAGPWSGNSVYNTLVGAESGGRNDGAPGQPAGGDGGIARGYFNIQTPTWGDFAKKVPGASQYQTADQAPYEIQRAVANTIPVARFGDRTRRILHSKFGDFNEQMTVGQLADQKGGNLDVARTIPAYSVGNAALPPSSRPMVAGP